MHYRPKRPIVVDLPGQPDDPVLTARTPVERVAMGLIMASLARRDLLTASPVVPAALPTVAVPVTQ